MRALILLMLLVAGTAAALAPSVSTQVFASGNVSFSNGRETCEVPWSFEANLATRTGVSAFGAGECLLFYVYPFAFGQCHEFCGGQCDGLADGTIECWWGESRPEWVDVHLVLRLDGAMTFRGAGASASGTVARIGA